MPERLTQFNAASGLQADDLDGGATGLPRENSRSGATGSTDRVEAAHGGTRCQRGRVAMQKVEGSSPL